MSDPGGPPPRGAFAGVGAVGAVAATVLILILAAWAASIGTEGVLDGSGPAATEAPSESSGRDSAEPPVEPESDEPAPDEAAEPSRWGRVIAVLAQITTGVVLLYVLFRVLAWLRRRYLGRRRRTPPPPVIDFETLEAQIAEETAEAFAADMVEQQHVLASGEARNAIVACWHRFEVLAERVGLERASWETSEEFVARVLNRVTADAEAITELAGLYRVARFSEHPLGERSREQATRALQRIHDGLSVRALRGGG